MKGWLGPNLLCTLISVLGFRVLVPSFPLKSQKGFSGVAAVENSTGDEICDHGKFDDGL